MVAVGWSSYIKGAKVAVRRSCCVGRCFGVKELSLLWSDGAECCGEVTTC